MLKRKFGLRGLTLIELLVSTGIAAFVAIVGIEVMQQRQKSTVIQEREVQTASQARQFFDLRAKVFRGASEATLGGLIAPRNIYLQSVAVTSNLSGLGSFTETLSNICTATARPLAFDAADQALLAECLPNCNNVPRISIARTGCVAPIVCPAPQEFPSGNGSGLDGNPIGAVLCMRANGDNNSYRDLNFKLLTFIRVGNNRVKMIPYEASFPRPKAVNANSIQILGTVRE